MLVLSVTSLAGLEGGPEQSTARTVGVVSGYRGGADGVTTLCNVVEGCVGSLSATQREFIHLTCIFIA